MQTFLKNYYDEHYFKYEVNRVEDYIHEKVWNIYFDEQFDMIYIFMARFRVIRG